MPLYEYFCEGCLTGFEALVALSSAPQARIGGKPDVTSLRLPPAARLCWMDDRSAARLAAYKAGRGAEYDDTVAARKELALRHGDCESSEPATPAHSHSP